MIELNDRSKKRKPKGIADRTREASRRSTGTTERGGWVGAEGVVNENWGPGCGVCDIRALRSALHALFTLHNITHVVSNLSTLSSVDSLRSPQPVAPPLLCVTLTSSSAPATVQLPQCQSV